MVHYLHGKSVHIKGGLPSTSEGLTLQTKERRAMPMITYSDLIQTGIFIVALVGLVMRSSRIENSRPLLPIVNG